MAKAIASAIQNCTSDNLNWISAFNIDNKNIITVRCLYPSIGTVDNYLYENNNNKYTQLIKVEGETQR